MKKLLLLCLLLGASSLAIAQEPDPNWQYAADMSTTRRDHAVVVLNDGKLMAIGGFDGNSSVSSAEVYDPYYNMWSSVASMNSARSSLMAVVLDDDRVLVAGGC